MCDYHVIVEVEESCFVCVCVCVWNVSEVIRWNPLELPLTKETACLNLIYYNQKLNELAWKDLSI